MISSRQLGGQKGRVGIQRRGSSNEQAKRRFEARKDSHDAFPVVFTDLSVEHILHRREESIPGEMSGDPVGEIRFVGFETKRELVVSN